MKDNVEFLNQISKSSSQSDDEVKSIIDLEYCSPGFGVVDGVRNLKIKNNSLPCQLLK